MALPTLIDYRAPVPPREPLPVNRPEWTLEPTKAAVLVHDLQRYFVRIFAPGCPALDDAVTACGRLLEVARAEGLPIFYTAQSGDQDPADRGLQADLWGPGMSAILEHTEILPEVAPADSDTILVKHRYNAFARSDLAQRLSAAGRTQLIIVGVYTHIGITATAFEAFQREIHPFVVADATADFTAEHHRRALHTVSSCCGIVTLTDDVISAITTRTASVVT